MTHTHLTARGGVWYTASVPVRTDHRVVVRATLQPHRHFCGLSNGAWSPDRDMHNAEAALFCGPRQEDPMTCVICGKDRPAARARFKTCSDECHREFYRRRSAQKKADAQARREERQCPVCGEMFHPCKPTSQTCSRKCANTLVARETAPQRSEAMKRWFDCGGQDCGDAIVLKRPRKSYPKRFGRHEHRVVMEQKLGRKLVKGEVVHHIDGDKTNNEPDNLELFPSQANHCRDHFTKYARCEVDGCLLRATTDGMCRAHYRLYAIEVMPTCPEEQRPRKIA